MKKLKTFRVKRTVKLFRDDEVARFTSAQLCVHFLHFYYLFIFCEVCGIVNNEDLTAVKCELMTAATRRVALSVMIFRFHFRSDFLLFAQSSVQPLLSKLERGQIKSLTRLLSGSSFSWMDLKINKL